METSPFVKNTNLVSCVMTVLSVMRVLVKVYTNRKVDVDYIAVDIDQRTKGENVDIIIKGKGQFCVKKEATEPNFVCQLMQRKKIKEHTNFVQLPTSRIICTYYV